MTTLSQSDIALIRAAASLAAHVPGRMHAAHLAPRLQDLATRLAAQLPATAHQATMQEEEIVLLRAA